MRIFCGQEESHQSGCREDAIVFSTPVEKPGGECLPYAIRPPEASVPVTEMTLSAVTRHLGRRKTAGLPLKVDV